MEKKLLIAAALAAFTLAAETKVLVFSGSTRTESENKKLAAQSAEIARELGAQVTLIDLRDYPMAFYDGDLEREKGMPENAKAFRKMLFGHDLIVISTPEYNGSITGVLKNAIDWASRDEEGKPSYAAFKGKRFVLMSYSGGATGGAGALSHLRAILERVGGIVSATQVNVARSRTGTPEKEKEKSEMIKTALREASMGNT